MWKRSPLFAWSLETTGAGTPSTILFPGTYDSLSHFGEAVKFLSVMRYLMITERFNDDGFHLGSLR